MARSEVRRFEVWGIAIAAVVILGILPALNAFVPETNPLHVSNFTINLYGKYLTYAVLAIGVDVLWGFTGLLSLGQCLFFALGGYAFGMYLMLKIGKLGQYKSELPDFMVFLGYNKLPSHWVPFHSFWFAVAAVVLVPGIVAFVFGFLAFRSRIRGVYFSILTQALTYGACLMFFRNDFTFGGNNGLTDFKFVLNYDINSAATQRAFYMLSGLLLLGSYVFSRWLTTTKFGKVQRAIRDSENRVLFSGYATANFKLFVFVYAAVISGLAGALYTPQVGIINPSEMSPEKSLEAVVWVAVGGRGTLIGPIIGSVGVNALKSWATRAYPDLWLIILGGLFVLIVLFMPKGIVGIPGQIQELRKRFQRRESAVAVPASGAASSSAE
ncbi:MAG TPA: urea ABC transporter permease subunit UrtC [Terrimicrobium sp.]